jgi:hypothetical protein
MLLVFLMKLILNTICWSSAGIHNPLESFSIPSVVIKSGPRVLTWDDWVVQRNVSTRKVGRKVVVGEAR